MHRLLVLAFLPAVVWAGPVVELPAVREQFVSNLVSLRPEAATGLGMAGFAGQLSIPTVANLQKQVEFFQGVETQLQTVHGRDSREEIDRQVMLTIARSQLRELREKKSYLTDVGMAQGPHDIVQLQVAQAGTGEKAILEWRGIISRAMQTPEYIKAVRDNLAAGAAEGRQVYRGFVEKEGIEAANSAAEFFYSELDEKARQQLSPSDYNSLRNELAEASLVAGNAYKMYAKYLEESILPKATEKYGIGEAEYAWKLKNELGLKESPAQLEEKGRKLAESITARMESLAKQIDPTKTLAEVMADLRADHPKDDAALIAKYKEVSDRARDFVVKNELFAIPADYAIDVIETPAAMRSHIGSAMYYPAPPLDASKKGVFLVTPSAGNQKRLAIHNHSKIPTTVVHEAFPGHDMQFWSFQRANVPTVRHLLDQGGFAYSLNVEGYAHYAEELMRQKGFFTPKEELTQLGAQLWRAWRIVLDSGLHTGKFSMAEVAKTLTEKAFQPEAIAQVEAHRYAKMPTQALTYALGRLEIESLKDEYKKKTGKGYSEAAFHEAFLSFGPVLPALIRPALLEEARPGSVIKRVWESSAGKVALSVVAAAIYGAGVYLHSGAQAAQEFLSVYLIEWTLSLDNLVVLATVIHALPKQIRNTVLGWGIAATIVLRLGMLTAGMGIVAAAPAAFVVFGAFLAVVAAKMLNHKWDLIGKVFGWASSKVRLKKTEKPRWMSNPMVWGLAAVIGYDAVFALDSVPAALAISSSLAIVFAANVFSLFGLRSLFKVLDVMQDKFRYLNQGVGVVLLFVAAKMIAGPLFHFHVGSLASMIVVLGTLGGAVLLSLLKKPAKS